MGGFIQPQGNFQIISNLIDKGLNPQQSIDHPRFRLKTSDNDDTIDSNMISNESTLNIENQYNYNEIISSLKSKGHNVSMIKGHARSEFGRAQIIFKDPSNGILWGGSDGRGDGSAIGIDYPSKL